MGRPARHSSRPFAAARMCLLGLCVLLIGSATAQDEAVATGGSSKSSSKKCAAGALPSAQPPDVFFQNALASFGTLNFIAKANTSAAKTKAASLSGVRTEQQATREPPRLLPRRRRAWAAATAAAIGSHSKPANKSHVFPLPTTLPSGSGSKGFAGATDWRWRVSDEGLAVGPHSRRSGWVWVVHTINTKLTVFQAKEDGSKAAMLGSIEVQDLQAAANLSALDLSDPSAAYDPINKRFIVVWTSYAFDPDAPDNPPSQLLVATTTSDDPTGNWVVKGMLANLPMSTGLNCSYNFIPDYPQFTIDANGLYISAINFCGAESDLLANVVWAYPLERVYARKAATPVPAAGYTAAGAWTASLPTANPLFEPIDQIIMTVRPQSRRDVAAAKPYFFSSLPGTTTSNKLSIAVLTATDRLCTMTSAASAPTIRANIIWKGLDPISSNLLEFESGPNVSQPLTDNVLDAGDVGGYGRSYVSSLSRGTLYLTTVEYWGSVAAPQVVVYFAFVTPKTPNLCTSTLTLDQFGIVQSSEGLGLMYPAIAATSDGGAWLAYSYSGPGVLPNGKPSFAGAAVSRLVEGHDGVVRPKSLKVVAQGEGAIIGLRDGLWQRWGDFAAVSVTGDTAWFAISRAQFDPALNNATTVPARARPGTWIWAEPLDD